MQSSLKKEFLNLGKHPIANAFLKKEDFRNEFLFDLKVCFNTDTKLVSIKEFVEPKKIFNENYPYNTSNSFPMIKHFKNIANLLKEKYNPQKVLEIGSNSGPFIENFKSDNSICVEPCGNFAKVTEDMGYKTYVEFWTTDLAKNIKKNDGEQDLIFAANCICHIHNLDDTFAGVKNLLSKDGVFVFEDPSLFNIIQRGSYDQIYDEHPHIFSVIALDNLLRRNGLKIFAVDNLNVHGGSNRIYANHIDVKDVETSVITNKNNEIAFGLDNFTTYENFAKRVSDSKSKLTNLLKKLKSDNKKIISIGATAKSTTVFNYCGIGSDIIDVISDTTIEKQNTYSPGMHIPVVSPEKINMLEYDYAYLGAWNFKDVIVNNNKDFINNGGKFITHVPDVIIF
tara:strand:+ start:1639 stop:2826 length:1188 start_codon:yes stop_codon:yes gene_type:complete